MFERRHLSWSPRMRKISIIKHHGKLNFNQLIFSQIHWSNSCRKIVMMLVFLAILAILLLQDDDVDISSEKKPREIPNPEVTLPPSPSVLHAFKHAAVSSDSQVCSEVARWGSWWHWLEVSLSCFSHLRTFYLYSDWAMKKQFRGSRTQVG